MSTNEEEKVVGVAKDELLLSLSEPRRRRSSTLLWGRFHESVSAEIYGQNLLWSIDQWLKLNSVKSPCISKRPMSDFALIDERSLFYRFPV
jgi:hypothetical protein